MCSYEYSHAQKAARTHSSSVECAEKIELHRENDRRMENEGEYREFSKNNAHSPRDK